MLSFPTSTARTQTRQETCRAGLYLLVVVANVLYLLSRELGQGQGRVDAGSSQEIPPRPLERIGSSPIHLLAMTTSPYVSLD